jgi:hypothetical protein
LLERRRQKERFEPFAHEHFLDRFLQERAPFLVAHTDDLRRLAYARLREADAVFFIERAISIYITIIFFLCYEKENRNIYSSIKLRRGPSPHDGIGKVIPEEGFRPLATD